jgi:hypothetical protein
MTLRLTIGVDPGQSGAIAMLADGASDGFIDMPTCSRKAGGQEVDAASLAASLRGVLQKHRGAYVVAVLEAVSAMPKQGVSSGFRFGESFGIVKGVLATLGIGYILVPPQMWKKHLRLTGCDKDAARTLVIQRFPACAESMKRKKDVGRADALLLAHWGELTEQVASAA